MRINDAMVVELLKANHKVSDEQLKGLLDQQKTDKRPLQDLVLADNLISEKDFVQAYADRVDVPFVEVIPKNIRKLFGMSSGIFPIAHCSSRHPAD